DILFGTVDTTWQAYNHWSDNGVPTSFYDGAGGRAFKISYNRPFEPRGMGNANIFNHELALVRWLEQNGYDVSYSASIDMIRHADLMRNHKIYLRTGHDQYWSLEEKRN